MVKIDFTVVLEPCEEGGFLVTCPALPGCISEGDTKKEAIENIKDAIALYIRAMAKETLEFNTDNEKEVVKIC